MKAIFFDIDGTIYSPELGGITQEVIQAIHETQAKGHLCFVASGRPLGYIASNVKKIGFDGYVLNNGAHIRFHGKNMSEHILPYHKLRSLVDILEEKNWEYVLEATDYCYLKNSCKHLLEEYYPVCNIDYENFVYDYDLEEALKKTCKLEIHYQDEQGLAYLKEHLDGFSFEPHDQVKVAEVYADNVSKGSGILEVLDHFDIPVDQSYCFGDGLNDIEMFETVGHPIAMDNAQPIIKERAETICESVLDNGVAKELERLF